MKAVNSTLIKLTLFLITGIYLGFNTKIPLNLTVYALLFFGTALTLSYYFAKGRFNKTLWFGCLSFIATFGLGVLIVQLHEPQNFKSHYSNYLNKHKTSKAQLVSFKIRETLKPNPYYNKYMVAVLKINNQKVKGKLLLNIKKDTTITPLKAGYIYTCKAPIQNINTSLNPGQFSYKNYLKKQYTYHQIKVSRALILKTESNFLNIYDYANKTRDFINLKLNKHHFTANQKAIINALFLGQKQAISKSLYNSYKNAGVIHILSISGLHMGAILILLNFLLSSLNSIKNGLLIKTILVIGLLWCFAFIAGLSASITRSATMFSIIAIGINLKRPTNTFNTVVVSLFILLLIKPLFLFDVGFQLSYCAVLAIVIITPLLLKLWTPKNKIVYYYWQITTVTVAAQLGVLPLCVYYFNQIPGLFFISNLIIVPLLIWFLAFGFFIITLALLNILPKELATVFKQTINLINNFVAYIGKQDFFIIKDIPFNKFNLITWYLILFFGFVFLQKQSLKSFRNLLLTIIFIQCVTLYNIGKPEKHKFIVFHKNKHSILSNVYKNKITTSYSFNNKKDSTNNIVRNYKLKNNIKATASTSFKKIYTLKHATFFVIDSLAVYNVKLFNPDYLLLRQSPKLNLERVIDAIKPKYIIADGSNYISYVTYWKKVCEKRKLPFYHTGKKGAFIINY